MLSELVLHDQLNVDDKCRPTDVHIPKPKFMILDVTTVCVQIQMNESAQSA